MNFDTYAAVRPATSKLLDMMDEGLVDARAIADMALSWLSEREVRDMMLANDLVEEEEEDEEEEYPAADEATERADFGEAFN